METTHCLSALQVATGIERVKIFGREQEEVRGEPDLRHLREMAVAASFPT